MKPIHIRKLANAFIPDAVVAPVLPGAAARAADSFKKKRGGLWVGGSVEISPEGIGFSPNGLNKAVHVGLHSISIPAANIRSVKREFGWVTGIVVVGHASGEFRFRCYGAKQVAAAVSANFGTA